MRTSSLRSTMCIAALFCATLGSADCVRHVETAYGIPPGLLGVIAHIEGAGAGFARRSESRSADLGLMQINTIHWDELDGVLPDGASPWRAIYSRCYSAALGGWVLSRRLLEHGDPPVGSEQFWQAVGSYHSRTPEKRAPYVAKLRVAWELAHAAAESAAAH